MSRRWVEDTPPDNEFVAQLDALKELRAAVHDLAPERRCPVEVRARELGDAWAQRPDRRGIGQAHLEVDELGLVDRPADLAQQAAVCRQDLIGVKAGAIHEGMLNL